MARTIFGLAAIVLLAAPASAGVLSVRVSHSAGRPVRDAVVALYPAGQARAARPSGRYAIAQKYPRAPSGKLEQVVGAAQRQLSFTANLRPPPPAMPMDY